MREAMDIGGTVGPLLVANGHFENFEIELGRSEQQVEISEWIEFAEIGSVRCDTFIVSSEQHFRPTERVLDPFAEQPRKCHAEKLIPQ